MRDTKVTINLQALLHNLEMMRQLAPKSKCLAMLKANAYGHGATYIAPTLEPHVEGFGVCTVEEAEKLREAGIKAKILILQGVYSEPEYSKATELKLDCVIHHVEQLQWLLSSKTRFTETIWLKANTGMNRLGMKEDQFTDAVQKVIDAGYEPILMSHLACADQREHLLNRKQIDCFERLTRSFDGIERSLLNSAGIVSFPKHHYEWIRPGLSLYGISPFKNRTKVLADLKPVMNLEAKIISKHILNVGETVGYTARWLATRKSEIAIVAIGYGDGYPRDVPNGTEVLINDRLYPTAGVVSMDALAVDITEAPESIPLGTPCRLWGEGVPVELLANRLNRIPYEIVTQVTARPNRIEHSHQKIKDTSAAA